jgi:predicted nucleic acid-binding protein
MMSKAFLDTNVLVYALDRHEPRRRKRARTLIADVRSGAGGVISTQVLQELFVVATKKLSLDPLRVKAVVHWFEKHFEVVVVNGPLIREAIDCFVLNRLSFWDALLVVAAESARATTLYTEDLNDGQTVRGVTVKNPFSGA